MVSYKDERPIYLWRVNPRATPVRAGKPVTLTEVISLLRAAYDQNKAEVYLTNGGQKLKPGSKKNDKNRVFIADFQETTGHVTLVVTRGDTAVSDPSILNRQNGAVRHIKPGATESQAWSTHVVISKTASKFGTYKTCCERVPHVGSSYVHLLINDILDRQTEHDSNYQFPKKPRSKKAAPEFERYRPFMEVQKVQSEELRDTIKSGAEVTAVTLVKAQADMAGLDAFPQIKSSEQKLVLRVKKNSTDFAVINRLAKLGKKHGYSEVQVKLDNLPDDERPAQPRFGIELDDAKDTWFVRTHIISGFSKDLQNCYQKIEPEIQSKIIGLIGDDSRWR